MFLFSGLATSLSFQLHTGGKGYENSQMGHMMHPLRERLHGRRAVGGNSPHFPPTGGLREVAEGRPQMKEQVCFLEMLSLLN